MAAFVVSGSQAAQSAPGSKGYDKILCFVRYWLCTRIYTTLRCYSAVYPYCTGVSKIVGRPLCMPCTQTIRLSAENGRSTNGVDDSDVRILTFLVRVYSRTSTKDPRPSLRPLSDRGSLTLCGSESACGRVCRPHISGRRRRRRRRGHNTMACQGPTAVQSRAPRINYNFRPHLSIATRACRRIRTFAATSPRRTCYPDQFTFYTHSPSLFYFQKLTALLICVVSFLLF